MSPRGVFRHQWVQSRIVYRLLEWADSHGAVALVEQDLHRDGRTYVIPDVMLLTGTP